jgi:thiol:disulfide interchange protein
MVKFLVILFVAVWILGLLLGRRRRLIRDVNHLLELIFTVVFVFMGSTLLKKEEWVRENVVLYVLALALVFGASYLVARLIVRVFIAGRKSEG